MTSTDLGDPSAEVAASTDAFRSGSEPRRAQLLQWAALALPVVLLALLAWSRRWMSDDGFINLRVVRELQAGHGPVLNAGSRVEVATSPLWVAILAVADAVTPVRLEWLAVVLGIAAMVGGLTVALVGSARLHTDGATIALVPVGAIVFVVVRPVWDFASSGLETGISIAWLGWCFLLLARWAQGRRLGYAAAIIIGLGSLVRPDFVLFTFAFLIAYGAVMWREHARGELARIAAVMAAPFVVSEVLRAMYFGVLVPNTALAKEGSRLRLGIGMSYLRDFVGAYWLWVPLFALLVGVYAPLVVRWWRAESARKLAVLLAFLVAGVLHGFYVVAIGGDFMHARLLLPAFFALCTPIAAIPLRRAHFAAVIALGWAAICLASLRPPANVGTIRSSFIGDVRSAASSISHRRHPVTLADYDAAPGGPIVRGYKQRGGTWYELRPVGAPPPDGLPVPAIAMYGIGVRSYALGVDWYVLDLVGLGDALDAHFELDQRGTPGHEKPMPAAWAAARLVAPGAPLDLQTFSPPAFAIPLFRSTPESFPGDVAAARAALECGPIRDLNAATTGRLTITRAFKNLFGAPRRTLLRVPADPTVARQELC